MKFGKVWYEVEYTYVETGYGKRALEIKWFDNPEDAKKFAETVGEHRIIENREIVKF